MWQEGGGWNLSPRPGSAAGVQDTAPRPSSQKDLFFGEGQVGGQVTLEDTSKLRKGQPQTALPSRSHVLPVCCFQSLSRRLRPRRQLLLEGQTVAAEPAGCSPGTLPCRPTTATPATG